MKTLPCAIGFILSLMSLPILAQNETDVLRLSQNFTGGTARAVGMGGAFGALGGDMTSMSINPAGLGVYRASEFTFSPTIGSDNTKATYWGNPYTDSKMKLTLNNIGYVYTFNTNKDQGWVSASFGIAYNRLNDFNRNTTITAVNPNSSMLDGFTSNLNWNNVGNVDLSNNSDYSYYEALAQNTNAIWYEPDSGRFINYFDAAKQHNELQTQVITTKGGVGEYAFSFGANYSYKLYLGVTLGVDNVNYESVKSHTESQTPNINLIDNFNFTENFRTWGTGYNIKLGVIYKPIDLIRLGLAFHSPTYYSLSSDFYTSMNVNYRQPPFVNGTQTYYSDQTDVTNFDYNIASPMRLISSVALQFKKFGVLSLDYEYLDYTMAKIRASGDPFTDVNNTIQSTYKATGNLKVGAEAKLGNFALRAGFGYYGSPYKSNNFNKNAFTTSYSAGLGYRGQSFFFDLGYILFNTKYSYALYTYKQSDGTAATETADLTSNYGKYIMTFGYRF
jgi:hypothetical protein